MSYCSMKNPKDLTHFLQQKFLTYFTADRKFTVGPAKCTLILRQTSLLINFHYKTVTKLHLRYDVSTLPVNTILQHWSFVYLYRESCSFKLDSLTSSVYETVLKISAY